MKGQLDLGTFRNAKEWTGYLKRFAFLTECVDFHTRTGVRFRVPVSLSQFEVKRQDSVLQFSGRCAIRVGLDSRLGNGRFRLPGQFNRCKECERPKRY